MSPQSLVTSQRAFGISRWLSYSAFLEVASAGSSSGFPPSTCSHLPACRVSLVPLISGKPSGTEDGERSSRLPAKLAGWPPSLSHPKAPPPEPPHRAAQVRRHRRRNARHPGGPQAPPPSPTAGIHAGPRHLPHGKPQSWPDRRDPGDRGRKGRGRHRSPDPEEQRYNPTLVASKMEPGAGPGRRSAAATAPAR